ncbi:MAG: putative manganese-dependent inorganic diphosphatase [Eubacterium sp.]|jgi:manganese-dependent inorganic pyrophosphatase|nr:putative manganese-dependent inorganic diphosphatase [Eubacterium sp.]
MDFEQENSVWVIGHRNPDTDSICAAIAYADLQNHLSETKYEPKRAGNLNEETKYVLRRFKVKIPAYVDDVRTQVKDIAFRRTIGVSSSISLKRAWELMTTSKVVTLPITGEDNELLGLIVNADIAESYMDVLDTRILAEARTPYKNMIETLNGTILVGNEHGRYIRGKVIVAADSLPMAEESMEKDDLVILGDRESMQKCALKHNASCLIICGGTQVSKAIITEAQDKECVIISTPYDPFTVSRLIMQSMPIKQFMRTKNLKKFEIEDYVDDVREVMSKARHRDFPILDHDGYYIGMISRRNLLNMQKKRVVLVDHNEKQQAVHGIDNADILGIIDHHKIGSLETPVPVMFRNQPVGCTSTIIYQMYQENGVKITKSIAGLLCSAIISDTLLFRSPTCTQADKDAAAKLAEIADIDMERHANEMFRAGSNFETKTTEEICYQDFKTFTAADILFGVSQISAMSREELDEVKERVLPYQSVIMEERGLQMVFIMLTDILNESSELICLGKGADEAVEKAFYKQKINDGYRLRGVVSRKKQLIPELLDAIMSMQA